MLSGFPTNSILFHRMPVVSQIPSGETAPLLRISRVTNLGHNRLNRISERFPVLACRAGVAPPILHIRTCDLGLRRAGESAEDNGRQWLAVS